jgi:opacity protein-like surface antigen
MRMNAFRTICLAVAATAMALVGTTAAAGAQERRSGPYFDADLGASLVESVRFRDGAESLKVEFDPGIRFSMSGGYRFELGPTAGFCLELETGVLWNQLDRASLGPLSASLDGDLFQVPFLANAILSIEPTPQLDIYFGGGGGGNWTRLTLDRIGGLRVGGTENDVRPAVQGMAGIRYHVNDRSSLGVGYKFLNTFFSSAPDIKAHAASVTYTLSF